MRLVLSKGQVNIYPLAKNAGTSVEQIERFDARNLPMAFFGCSQPLPAWTNKLDEMIDFYTRIDE